MPRRISDAAITLYFLKKWKSPVVSILLLKKQKTMSANNVLEALWAYKDLCAQVERVPQMWTAPYVERELDRLLPKVAAAARRLEAARAARTAQMQANKASTPPKHLNR